MIHKFSRYLLTLVALLAMTTGAWADDLSESFTTTGGLTYNGEHFTITGSNCDGDGFYLSKELSWTATITSKNGEVITKIEMTYTWGSGHAASTTATAGTMSADGKSVTNINGTTVTISTTADTDDAIQINSWKIYYTAPAEPDVKVTISTDQQSAEFDMPSYDATLEYDIVRNLASNMTAEIADRIRIQKNEGSYEAVTATEMQPVITDLIANNKVLVVNTDYTLQLQKKVEGETPTWEDVTALSVGTFRFVVTGKENSNYGGEITTSEFQLFEGYEVVVPAGEYITYYKDEALYVEDENAELYTISSVTATEAQLSSKLTVAPANTPLLVYNNSSTEAKKFLLIPTTDKQPTEVTAANEFRGTLTQKEFTPTDMQAADYYVCTGKAFIWVKDPGMIAANRCWLQIGEQPATSRANTRSITGGNGTTGIDAIENATIDNEGWYDLQGRKLQSAPNRKGIYIHNGKKVVVRK